MRNIKNRVHNDKQSISKQKTQMLGHEPYNGDFTIAPWTTRIS